MTETGIPQELRDLAQWVVYRIEVRDQKRTKVPYQSRSTRSKASTTTRATWSTYEQACEALDRDPTLNGLGFVFSDSDPYCGIDLDHCIKDGVLNQAAEGILKRLNSYSEYSPSGEGVHCIVEATVARGKKSGEIEIYSSGRYFTMTDRHIPGTPFEIYNRQDVVDELCQVYFPEDEDEPPAQLPAQPNNLADHELLRAAFGFKNGDELRRLYEDGDTSRHNGDDSAADLALCNHLAFLTGRDPVRMDQLFRASALYRKKWDERHGQLTYGQMTIQKAIANCKEVYTPGGQLTPIGAISFAADPLSFDQSLIERRRLIGEVMRNGIPPTPWLIEPVLVSGNIHLLYGEPESGKTILCLSFVNRLIEQGKNVLFIDEESGIQAIAKRLQDMDVDPDLVDRHVYYIPFPSIDRKQYPELLNLSDQLQPALVMFDSLTDMLSVSGLDENNGNEVTSWMLEVAQAIARRDYQPAVVLVDHVTKDTGNVKYSVASRAKKAKSDILWLVDKQAEFDGTKTARVDLIQNKNRPGVLPKRVSFTVGGENGVLICRPFDADADYISSLTPQAEQMLKALKDNGGEMTPAHVAKLFGVHQRTVLRWATELVSAERIEKLGATSNAAYKLRTCPETAMDMSEVNSGHNFGHLPPSIGAMSEVSDEREKRRRIVTVEDFE